MVVKHRKINTEIKFIYNFPFKEILNYCLGTDTVNEIVIENS